MYSTQTMHHKYQVKPHSFPWSSAACATAIVHRNHFFHMYQQNKFSESKVKFRQASNYCKNCLKLLASLFKNFSRNPNLDDLSINLPVFPSRTNLKLHNISVTPKMVKKVIMNLDLSKASGLDCIPVVVLKNCEPELSYILILS